jgi:hypothetical protein
MCGEIFFFCNFPLKIPACRPLCARETGILTIIPRFENSRWEFWGKKAEFPPEFSPGILKSGKNELVVTFFVVEYPAL